jgi:hypothetical protein
MFRDGQGRFVLAGDGSFRFRVVVDGDDLLVENARATWFGGNDDKDDNGHTASGVLNDQEGNLTPMGCALPIPGEQEPAAVRFRCFHGESKYAFSILRITR